MNATSFFEVNKTAFEGPMPNTDKAFDKLDLVSLYLSDNGFQRIMVQTLLTDNWMKGNGFQSHTYILNYGRERKNIIGRYKDAYFDIREASRLSESCLEVEFYRVVKSESEHSPHWHQLRETQPRVSRQTIECRTLDLADPASLPDFLERLAAMEEEKSLTG